MCAPLDLDDEIFNTVPSSQGRKIVIPAKREEPRKPIERSYCCHCNRKAQFAWGSTRQARKSFKLTCGLPCCKSKVTATKIKGHWERNERWYERVPSGKFRLMEVIKVEEL